MAAGDFTASTLQKVQLEMSRIWSEGATTNVLNTPIETAQVLLGTNGMVEIPTIRNGQCVATKVYHLTDTNSDDVTYSGNVPDATLTCDVADGEESESVGKEYSPDLFINQARMVKDELCDNEYTLARLTAYEMMRGMAKIRKELNKKAIIHLNALAQAPIAGSTNYTVTGTNIEVPEADFTPDLIASIYRTSLINQATNIKLHNGSNFFERYFNATYNQLNDNERDQLAKLGALGSMSWDVRAMDQQLTENATFSFDPQMLGFFNYKGMENYEPRLTDPAKGIWEFIIEDPILTYQRIVRNELTGEFTFETVPVTYIVEYQKACINDRDGFSNRVYRHKYLIKFVGGYTSAPQGAAGETRVFKWVKTAPSV